LQNCLFFTAQSRISDVRCVIVGRGVLHHVPRLGLNLLVVVGRIPSIRRAGLNFHRNSSRLNGGLHVSDLPLLNGLLLCHVNNLLTRLDPLTRLELLTRLDPLRLQNSLLTRLNNLVFCRCDTTLNVLNFIRSLRLQHNFILVRICRVNVLSGAA